jgi:hypothetical protein
MVPDGTLHQFIDSPNYRSPLAPNGNKFVHLALKNTLALAVALEGPGVIDALLKAGLQIHILGDNDFYSQRVTVRLTESAGPY